MTLPQSFVDDIQPLLPPEEWRAFSEALTQSEHPTSIRLRKPLSMGDAPVGWCNEGRYLNSRPQFTLDPLLHAGTYYVQEASSMFVSHVLRSLLPTDTPVWALDLCAAPGGKSTAALQALPAGSQLVSNEIDRKRARILAENIQKWGNPNVSVTANAPADFALLGPIFDVILTDVPCSGEGMFRKDPGAIDEWSPAKVRECVALQRQILADIWPCLKPGGLLVYSTCTFNTHEDEEMLQYIIDELGGEIVEIPIDPAWQIHPALCGPFAPGITPTSACRFMPHFTQGEGIFMAAIRKGGKAAAVRSDFGATSHRLKDTIRNREGLNDRNRKDNRKPSPVSIHPEEWLTGRYFIDDTAEVIRAIPEAHKPLHDLLVARRLFLLVSGVDLGTIKGKDICPAHALALSDALREGAFPTAELNLDTALNYLRREAIVLNEEVPTGYVLCTYQGHPLGFVKNIGNRSNNLYPTEWRIRNL